MAGLIQSLKTRLIQLITVARLVQRGVLKPETAPENTASNRVLIGPANSAGQGFQWGRALERALPGLEVTSMHLTASDTYRFPVDLTVHAGYAAYSRSWQKKQFDKLKDYRGVLVESNRGVLGRYKGLDTREQLELLRDAGVRTGLIFHGSDVRDPDMHLSREPHSYFLVDEVFTETLRSVTAASQRLIKQANVPVFVSTLDLLTDVPHAIWLPVVIDPMVWANGRAPLSSGRTPRVVHVPSQSFIKGSELIASEMQQLHDEGVISYHSVSGVEHSEMPDLYREADIVLDQFRGGPYGVAACEALAAGRIVVSHVPYRDRVQKHTGEDVPIIESSHTELRNTLLDILENPRDAQRMAEKGPGFVTRHHNGDRSGQVLAAWLEVGEA